MWQIFVAGWTNAFFEGGRFREESQGLSSKKAFWGEGMTLHPYCTLVVGCLKHFQNKFCIGRTGIVANQAGIASCALCD